MIRSMTGFGRSSQVVNSKEITVEIKSVNHRFFEFNSKLPRIYGFLDDKVKSFVQQRVNRGKIEAYISIFSVDANDINVQVNKSLIKGYVDELRSLSDEFNLTDDLSLSSIMRLPEIFNVKKQDEDEDLIWESVKVVIDDAVTKFIAMRELEGEKLKEDMLDSLSKIEEYVAFVEKRSPQTVEDYKRKLYNKISEILSEKNIDEQRVLTEVAIFADKLAVSEETVRIRSHISQYRDMLNKGGAIGKKLDFLTQELNRETNTIGSKCQDIEITQVVVNIKSEVEKIREQIQNIE